MSPVATRLLITANRPEDPKGEHPMTGPVNLPPYSVVQTIQGQQAAPDALKAQQDAEAQRAADMRAMMGALAVRNASTSQGR
jgi:hypothetical protein